MRYFMLVSFVIFLFSCSSETYSPLSSTDKEHSELLGKKGGKVKTTYTVDVIKGSGFIPTTNALLLSTCEGTSISTNYAVNWEKHTTCIVITPDPPLGKDEVTLSDDPAIYISQKRGKIVSIGLAIQNIDGPDGILHSASKILVEPPFTPTATGFTIPVRQNDIKVWRHKGHIGGPKVEMIGSISFGDIVFTPTTF